ncbi:MULTISPECIES: phage holin family protein [unclassified Acinetobacter]|uniref:phage holin family protein n=1 Tax=unclassified Acinetobacter TaxID=196816 RepID=UPI00190C8D43|nr:MULTISPECIES: phage holin family protein [unclassified Acinetobacter]MBK0062624.1 phage holin family protein [Acinetobacter sp. S55]MBK0065799.1 phage holin family protein [Acinetobacter sp. S54]
MIIFSIIAVFCYLLCGFRILSFERSSHHRGYAFLATILIASFIGQAVYIIFFKDPVTLWDAILAVLLTCIIYQSKGNVAKLLRRTS